MSERDREALGDILGVLDRALGFPIANLQTMEETDYLQDAVVRCLEVLDLQPRPVPATRDQGFARSPWRALNAWLRVGPATDRGREAIQDLLTGTARLAL